MAITSSFANLATVTRASKKTDAGGWDFVNATIVGPLSEYANHVASIPAAAGMLIEEASTNEITNPRFEGWTLGADAGSREPSSFVVRPDSTAGISPGTNVNAIGSENGWNYIEIEFDNSSGSSASWYMRFEPSNTIAAAVDEDWTFSCGFELVSGSLAGASIDLDLLQYAGASLLASMGGTSFASSIDSAHRRFFKSFTLTAATVDNIVPEIGVTIPAGAVFTIRLYAPQCENLAFPTSPILPAVASPAVSTRAADLVLLDLGSWFSSTAWTAFFSLKPATAGVTGRVVGGFGATFDNTIYLDIGTSGGTRASANFRSGGSSAALLTPSGQSNYAVGDTLKAAIGAEADNFAMSLNGATQATDTSGAMPVSNSRLSLGNGPWSASVNNTFCGYITDFRYFPRRLSNAELEALVGN